MNKPELLAPAGDFESLEAAVYFGADAVYLGGDAFSMRASPQNFNAQQLLRAVSFAHSHGVKVYLTCNTLPRNDEIRALPVFLEETKNADIDALIVSDLGVMELAKRYAPGTEIHMSTQTGVVNYAAACALHALGAKRSVLARELSLAEITELRENIPRTLEIEVFVHGAMCVSFSGRCLLSDYLTARDPNRGRCAQPCRWTYTLCEENRPGEHMPVFEDAKGTHILNARDLCMIGHIPELIRAGVTSFKIEGRAKSAYYVAAVTNAYRIAIDRYFEQKENYTFDPKLLDEVKKVSHRDYCTGFFFGPIEKGQIYEGDAYIRSWDIVAVVESKAGGLVVCRERNPFEPGEYEVVEPGKTGRTVAVLALYDEDGHQLERADHPGMRVLVKTDEPLCAHAMLRKAAN
jgi:U32 family peptidase